MNRLAIEMDLEDEWNANKIAWVEETNIEMQELLEAKKGDAPLVPWSRRDAYVASTAGKVERLEGRERVFGERRML